MGERKGQNHYYPPDFDPKKHKSLNGYHGTHALRERAKKLSEGILIIRFELPYNIWCDGCGNHVGMGVRYNAEKSKVGMYFTTPIYKFRMKCHLCDNRFEIQTDPKNFDYVIMSGARRKEQRWDPKENEQIVPEDKNSQKKMALDAMYKLEHGSNDASKAKKSKPVIAALEMLQDRSRDDYMANKALRNAFRAKKKELNAVKEADEELCRKSSLDIPLVAECEEDRRLAGLLTKFGTVKSFDEKRREKREEIDGRSIFASPVSPKSPKSGTTSSSANNSSTLPASLAEKLAGQATKARIEDTMNKTWTFSNFGLVRRKRKVSSEDGEGEQARVKNVASVDSESSGKASSPQPTSSSPPCTSRPTAPLSSLVAQYSSDSE